MKIGLFNAVALAIAVSAWGQEQQCKAEQNTLVIRDGNRDWLEQQLGRAIVERDTAKAEVATLKAEKAEKVPE
jgi:hypothetical protein